MPQEHALGILAESRYVSRMIGGAACSVDDMTNCSGTSQGYGGHVKKLDAGRFGRFNGAVQGNMPVGEGAVDP